MRRHHRDLSILSEMNLTNLLDTAFTLLIAFMLVAPTIKHGIELELPKISRGEMQTESKTLTIAIKKKAFEDTVEPIYIEDQRVTLDNLKDIIRERQAIYPKMSVLIEADKDATYDTVAKVLATLQNLGINNVGLPTLPEDLKD